MNKRATNRLVWLDLEMTGLDPSKDKIIEIATVVTDSQLNELDVGPVIAIHQSAETLAAMDDWNQRQHGLSGLTDRVQESTLTCRQAEQQTLAFLRRHVEDGVSPLCGNSVCMDRRFLAVHMAELHSFFHYRLLDVSSLKILAKMWYPRIASGVVKRSKHLALQDIRDSIAELDHYRKGMLRLSD